MQKIIYIFFLFFLNVFSFSFGLKCSIFTVVLHTKLESTPEKMQRGPDFTAQGKSSQGDKHLKLLNKYKHRHPWPFVTSVALGL